MKNKLSTNKEELTKLAYYVAGVAVGIIAVTLYNKCKGED